MGKARLSPSSVPFVPYLSSFESTYWTGAPKGDPIKRNSLWDPPQVPGAQPSIIEDNTRKFDRLDEVNVRFFEEDSHYWGPTIVARVMENLAFSEQGGGFVQTYVRTVYFRYPTLVTRELPVVYQAIVEISNDAVLPFNMKTAKALEQQGYIVFGWNDSDSYPRDHTLAKSQDLL
ncbi:hypothetical protein B0H21DRAFT_712735 [Amylocystis lapponica]|nr:hypothetical protein B0H21DRAFT_712735 [Amylocystis lapponica]